MTNSQQDAKVEVLEIRSTTQKTYTVWLAGCAPRSWPYSQRTYRPARLMVVKRDGNIASVEISGPQVRKDGTDGSQWAREKFYSGRERPDWLAPIIGGLA